MVSAIAMVRSVYTQPFNLIVGESFLWSWCGSKFRIWIVITLRAIARNCQYSLRELGRCTYGPIASMKGICIIFEYIRFMGSKLANTNNHYIYIFFCDSF